MKVCVLALSVAVLISSPAFACNFKDPYFGSSVSQISTLYKVNKDAIDVEDVDSVSSGELMISEEGIVVCDDLSEHSMVHFTYIDNKLVKIVIKSNLNSDLLFEFAKETFGESDDKDRKKTSDGRVNQALWAKSPKYSVIYTLDRKSNGAKTESISISSKKHSSLFGKIAEQKGKAMDAFLKERSLGKYSPSAASSSSDVNGNKGGYDANALEKLKQGYDKKNESWKKLNDANKKGR